LTIRELLDLPDIPSFFVTRGRPVRRRPQGTARPIRRGGSGDASESESANARFPESRRQTEAARRGCDNAGVSVQEFNIFQETKSYRGDAASTAPDSLESGPVEPAEPEPGHSFREESEQVFEAIAEIEIPQQGAQAATQQTTALRPSFRLSTNAQCAAPLSMESPKPLKVIRRRKSERAVVIVTSPRIIPQAMLIGVEKEGTQGE
jgi:hypothetical protein